MIAERGGGRWGKEGVSARGGRREDLFQKQEPTLEFAEFEGKTGRGLVTLVARHQTLFFGWYDGIDGIKVLAPGDANAQAVCDHIAAQQHSDVTGQFNAHRYARSFSAGRSQHQHGLLRP